MGLHVTNESGEEIAPIMGSYGIGIERILSAAVELYHDADGIVLPAAIAPFTVVVTPVNVKDDAQRQAAAEIYAACKNAGLDALLDDRDERPGVKFKDADLIGIPYRITVGKKMPQGIVELVERRPKRRPTCPSPTSWTPCVNYGLDKIYAGSFRRSSAGPTSTPPPTAKCRVARWKP